MSHNLSEVLNQATKKIAGLIQKSMNKNQIESRIGRTTEDLEHLIRRDEFDWFYLIIILMLDLTSQICKYVISSI